MDKIDFVNNGQPAVNDINLNLMQDNIENAINGFILYNNTSGNQGQISLTDDSTNYDYCEILYSDYDGNYNSVKIHIPNRKNFQMWGGYMGDVWEYGNLKFELAQFNEDKITRGKAVQLAFSPTGAHAESIGNSKFKIYRVIGYKTDD